MVAVAGVDDLIVISTKDATLIAKRGDSGAVKEVVQELAANGRTEAEHHLTVHRPWGSYETLHMSQRYQVKQIVVEPGGSLSLQKHHHRAEHWIVVKGNGAGYDRRRGEAALGERVGLCAAGRRPPAGKSGAHPADAHRGAVRPLSRRGRHRAPGGYLRARIRTQRGSAPGAAPTVKVVSQAGGGRGHRLSSLKQYSANALRTRKARKCGDGALILHG